MSKHYIRLNEQNYITHGFSTDFEQPIETDICINEDGGRHFELLGQINPSLNDMSIPKYKYENGAVLELTEAEKQAYKETLPKPPKSEIEQLKETIADLTAITLGV